MPSNEPTSTRSSTSRWTAYLRHRHMRHSTAMHLITKATRRSYATNKVLVKNTDGTQEEVGQDSQIVLCSCIGLILLLAHLKKSQFTVRTDHKALTSLRTMKEGTGKLTRCGLCLLELDFRVVHRAVVLRHEAAYRPITTQNWRM